MIRVAVIAAAPAVRAGLRVLLASDPSLQVIGDGATLDDLRHAPLAAAEVAVLHGLLPSGRLAVPDTLRGVLLVTDEGEAGLGSPAVGCAWGMLPGDASAEELIAGVTALYHGLLVIHPHLAAQVLVSAGTLRADADEPLAEPLTTREQEVLQLIGQGLSNKMIADRLHISEHTVKFHVSAIYAKLGVASRTEAVRSGARRGLIVL
ncbi:MAG TPA: response regulator transcription factor [Herpetosiphonaceae bacterium]